MEQMNTSFKIIFWIAFLLAFNNNIIPQTLKQSDSRPEPTMVGLSNDYIYVDISCNDFMFILGDVDKFISLIDQFSANTISRLRTAGIKVSDDDLLGKLKYPNFYVNISLLAIGNNQVTYGYAYSVRFGLWQKVILSRDRNIEEYGTTWARSEIGYASKENLIAQLHNVIKEKTNEFIIEYLKANSK